jgi:hypothetical protein
MRSIVDRIRSSNVDASIIGSIAGFANDGAFTRGAESATPEIVEYGQMDIATFCGEIRKQILVCRMESAKYAEQIGRNLDILESAWALDFADRASEALTDALRNLEALQETLQSTIERSDTSDQKSWDAGILSLDHASPLQEKV